MKHAVTSPLFSQIQRKEEESCELEIDDDDYDYDYDDDDEKYGDGAKKERFKCQKRFEIPRLNLFSRPDVTLLCEEIETGLDIESGGSDLYFESGDDGNERDL